MHKAQHKAVFTSSVMFEKIRRNEISLFCIIATILIFLFKFYQRIELFLLNWRKMRRSSQENSHFIFFSIMSFHLFFPFHAVLSKMIVCNR